MIGDNDESCCDGDDIDIHAEGHNHSIKQLE